MGDPEPFADDPYDVLGVEPSASLEEIEMAVAKAKATYNPDMYSEEEKREARDAFYEIIEAEEALLDGDHEGHQTDNPSSIEVETLTDPHTGTVPVTVSRDGEPVVGATVVVSETDETAVTDETGEAAVRIETAGEYEINAAIDVAVDTTHVSVSPRVVEPTVDVADDWTVGQPSAVAVAVEDEPVAGVTVWVGNESTETTADGVAEITPQQGGELPVVVPSDGRSRWQFEKWRDSVEVARGVRRLDLQAPTLTTVDTPTEITVEAAGEPVDAATVTSVGTPTADEQQIEATDGTAQVTFTAAGEAELEATAAPTDDYEYDPDTQSIDVWPTSPTGTVSLDGSTVAIGETVTVSVERDYDEEPVSNAQLLIERDGTQVEAGRTGVDGTETFSPKNPGEYEITVEFEAPTGDTVTATETLLVKGIEQPVVSFPNADNGQFLSDQRVRCKVVGDASRDPLTDVVVRADRLERDGYEEIKLSDGTARLDLQPGQWLVWAENTTGGVTDGGAARRSEERQINVRRAKYDDPGDSEPEPEPEGITTEQARSIASLLSAVVTVVGTGVAVLSVYLTALPTLPLLLIGAFLVVVSVGYYRRAVV
jgi:hypothetical protein